MNQYNSPFTPRVSMEREMDFEGWEVVPNAHHLRFEPGSQRESILSEDIEADYFSNLNNSTIEEPIEDFGLPLECKDIEVVLPSPPPSLVMFKKSNDDEFIDRMVKSPKASTKEPEHVLIEYPKVSIREPEGMLFDGENEDEDEFYKVEKTSEKEIEVVKPESKEKHPSWVVGGVGALCSIGMAAATICIFILSKGQLHNKHQHRQNPKIQFQIYADDKRINQVVQQATRLNHAISTTRAHISFGGYYDGI